MTTRIERGMVPQPGSEEVPVWQPELLHAEPLNAMDDAALDESVPYEAAIDAAPTVSEAPARRPAYARRAGSTMALLAISAMVALAGVSFAVGRVTATGQSGTGQTNNAALNGVNGGQNGLPGIGANASGAPDFGRGGPDGGLISDTSTVSGTVVSVTASSITVQLANGRTVTIATGSSTAYHKQTAATSTDVTTGATVIVQTSGTGTRTATDVTITGK
jgi:hypothetical protein